MSLNISEQFCEAVDQIVTARMQEVKFDKTIVCTVVGTENADTSNYYTVSEGSSRFSAYSVETYKENEQVLVLIPQGDYNNQKLIIGKHVSKDSSGYTFLDLKDQFLPLVEKTIPDSVQIKFDKQNIPPQQNILGEGVWTVGANTTTCTHIYLAADFRTNIAYKDGIYGIKLLITQRDGVVIQYQWDSAEFFGDPYNFVSALQQEYIISLDTSTSAIDTIGFYLFQNGVINSSEDYIEVSDFHCQIGYLAQETYLEELIVGVKNDTEKFYPSKSLIDEANQNLKELVSLVTIGEDADKTQTTESENVSAINKLSESLNKNFNLERIPITVNNANVNTETCWSINFKAEAAEDNKHLLYNGDYTINEEAYLLRQLNLTWKHVDLDGSIKVYKFDEKETSPELPSIPVDEDNPQGYTPKEGDTIQVIRWYVEGAAALNEPNPNWVDGIPKAEKKGDGTIEGNPLPDNNHFGITFTKLPNDVSYSKELFYPLTAQIKLSPEQITARVGAVLTPFVYTTTGDGKCQWIQNGSAVKSELFTFQQSGTVSYVEIQEDTDIPKNITNVAEEKLEQNSEQDSDGKDVGVHTVSGKYYYGSAPGSNFAASKIYSVICEFTSNYREKDYIKYINTIDSNKSATEIKAKLTMPNGDLAPDGAFIAGTLGILLIKEDVSNPIIQLPFIMK